MFITLVPKVLYFYILIRWLNNFGDFLILISGFIKLSVQSFQPLIIIYRKGNLVIIIDDVYQFISHCLIPLDPWKLYSRLKGNKEIKL